MQCSVRLPIRSTVHFLLDGPLCHAAARRPLLLRPLSRSAPPLLPSLPLRLSARSGSHLDISHAAADSPCFWQPAGLASTGSKNEMPMLPTQWEGGRREGTEGVSHLSKGEDLSFDRSIDRPSFSRVRLFVRRRRRDRTSCRVLLSSSTPLSTLDRQSDRQRDRPSDRRNS